MSETPVWKQGLSVEVINNDIERALKRLKKKMQNEGVMQDLRRHESYLKPGERRRRKKAQARQRALKRERQQPDLDIKLDY